ncbi:dihydrofolate reductase family protein [Chelativorans salis]|uniref:Dihydrofolate reductase family protein n=1 Tax=Chelativorans salis TaxID=2978478 RepID=A0ABT2LZK2_9HYPH|nr:dihydrofolate reductase family protein [Chelativorans sp. EGI FJ00035]MCT7378649.1 dihydrofolate reductase family protein [Chelativorans sp. EGI FJ00035]
MDEVIIHVAPVLVGDGFRLFAQKGMQPVRLDKTEVLEAGQIASMRFRFAG